MFNKLLDGGRLTFVNTTAGDANLRLEPTLPRMESLDARQSRSGATGLLPVCGRAWLVLARAR